MIGYHERLSSNEQMMPTVVIASVTTSMSHPIVPCTGGSKLTSTGSPLIGWILTATTALNATAATHAEPGIVDPGGQSERSTMGATSFDLRSVARQNRIASGLDKIHELNNLRARHPELVERVPDFMGGHVEFIVR